MALPDPGSNNAPPGTPPPGFLRILHLEDDSDDALLIKRKLVKEKFQPEIKVVATREAFTNALKKDSFDLILADCALHSFDGFEALNIALKLAPAIPYIFVSGAAGEDLAVNSVKSGATDYVLKHQLDRLGPAVRRAIREIKEREARRQADEHLLRYQQELADFFDHSPVGLHWAGPDGLILKVNQAELDMLGYTANEYQGHHMSEFHEDPVAIQTLLARLAKGETVQNYETRMRCKNGSFKNVVIESNVLWENGRFVHTRTFTRDITSRKRAENRGTAFSELARHLSSVATPLNAAEIIVETAESLLGWDSCSLDLYSPERNALFPVLVMDVVDGKRARVSPTRYGAPPTTLAVQVLKNGGQLILREEPLVMSPDLIPFGNRSRPSASLMLVPLRDGPKVIGILSIQSYTPQAYTPEDLNTLQALADHCGGALERIRAEETFSRLAAIVESSSDAIIGKTLNGIISSWNAGAEKIFGFTEEEVRGRSVLMLVPPDRVNEELLVIARIRRGERIKPFETVRVRKDGTLLDISATISPIRDAAGVVVGASQIAHDITERKRAETRIAALSRLGRNLSSCSTPAETAHVIGEIADGLFGWDALTLDLYLANEDRIAPVIYMDTIDGKKVEVSTSHVLREPTVSNKRVMASGAELVLKQPPFVTLPGEVAFGDLRPSASIMRVAIQYRNEMIGILSIHSYTSSAYNQSDLATLRSFADYCAGTLERMRVEEHAATLRTQLLSTARRAGMEEVANSVIHNVGNVLNSVNVSATLVADNLSQSKLSGLKQLSALLHEHAGDLKHFLTEHPQGSQLPAYLQGLADYWANEQAATLKELEALKKNINHIKDVISRQQSLTGTSGFVESLFISEVIEDALTMTASDLIRSDIIVQREFTMHFPIVADRMKLMLILVNLISNARDALLAANLDKKNLKLRTEPLENNSLRVSVSDDGIGIARENLTRVFSHGFTTKTNGHGFGLHSSALAAREMGGSMTVNSEGPHKGACFVLDLPLSPIVKKESAA